MRVPPPPIVCTQPINIYCAVTDGIDDWCAISFANVFQRKIIFETNTHTIIIAHDEKSKTKRKKDTAVKRRIFVVQSNAKKSGSAREKFRKINLFVYENFLRDIRDCGLSTYVYIYKHLYIFSVSFIMYVSFYFFTSPDATASPGMKSSGYMFSRYHLNDLHFNFLLNSLRDVMSP